MIFRLLAVAFIFVATSIAWAILGDTILARTSSSDERLRNRIQSVWGVPQIQQAPLAEYFVAIPSQKFVADGGTTKSVETTTQERHSVAPSSSDLAVGLNLEYRQKRLQWYSTHTADFHVDSTYPNPHTALNT